MTRRKKIKIEVENKESLEEVLQEVYVHSCNQIMEANDVIQELENSSIESVDIDDLTKVAKEKTNALKIKDSAIKIKVQIANIQKELLNKSTMLDDENSNQMQQAANVDLSKGFESIREMFKEIKNKKNE
jgi:hypothetical protein